MFLLSFIRYLLGYVRFSADGGSPEKFLNSAARTGIMLWHIKWVDGSLQAQTLARNYKKLLPVADKSGVRLSVIKCSGLPFKAKKVGRRKGLITGALLFVFILWFFSSFIWAVNVDGNSYTKTDEITEVLSELGLRPGAFPLFLNVKSIEQQALIKLPDLSWITININGTEADVKVRERKYPPDVVPADMPCNVKAAQTGQIISIETYVGKAMVRKGDTITKGDLLISGVITDRDGAVSLMHASGKAIARTSRVLKVTVPYRQRVKVETGTAVSKDTLNIFNFRVPLYFSKPTGDNKITISTNQLNVFGMKLPFSLTKRTYSALKEEDVVYTKAQAGAIAAAELAADVKTELAGINILNSGVDSNEDKNGYTLIGHYSCEEDIAYQEAITIP
jgi:similar to stage IV sporulation protein